MKLVFAISICLLGPLKALGQQANDFEFLNGTWSQACDSIVVGRHQGEFDCNPEVWTQLSFKFSKRVGTMIRQDFIVKESDTSRIKIEQIGDELYFIGSTNNEPWLTRIYELKETRIGLYSNTNTSITFYVR